MLMPREFSRDFSTNIWCKISLILFLESACSIQGSLSSSLAGALSFGFVCNILPKKFTNSLLHFDLSFSAGTRPEPAYNIAFNADSLKGGDPFAISKHNIAKLHISALKIFV